MNQRMLSTALNKETEKWRITLYDDNFTNTAV
jgi:hypothetical protein